MNTDKNKFKGKIEKVIELPRNYDKFSGNIDKIIPMVKTKFKSIYSIIKENQDKFSGTISKVIEGPPRPSGNGLYPNNEYILEVRYKSTVKRKEFISELDPLLCSIYQVRSTPIKHFISMIDDEEILVNIYENSRLVKKKVKEYNFDFDKEDIPFIMTQYVIAKSKYDIFLSAYLDMMSSSSSKYRLADFAIEASDGINNLKDLLDLLKDDVEEWEEKMKGGKAKGLSVMRAEGSYPFGERRF